MRILSLLFMPALALVYFAGTQHFSWWSIGALGWATVLLHFLIARLYAAALGTPVRLADYFASIVTGPALVNMICTQTRIGAHVPVYVATRESGIVLAHHVYTARYDGLDCVIVIESDSTKGSQHGKDS